jgi:hypothetical protein
MDAPSQGFTWDSLGIHLGFASIDLTLLYAKHLTNAFQASLIRSDIGA